MKYMHKLYCLIIVILLAVVTVLYCNLTTQKWYRIDYTGAQTNIVTISSRSNEGFKLRADCFNGANLGFFEGDFSFNTDNVATYDGKSFRGTNYIITVEFKESTMEIRTSFSNFETEWDLLGLGNAVTLSGTYSREKPKYDYSEGVLREVFLGDVAVSKEVKKYLGKDYDSFVSNFGVSTVYTEEINGYHIIIGSLRGIGDWCAFCATKEGYFYGVNNYKYFSNDPIYQNNPPNFLGSYYSFAY